MGAPVAAPARPQHRLPSLTTYQTKRKAVEHSVGWPIAARRSARGILDHRGGAKQIARQPTRRSPQQQGMAVAVQADLMTLRSDARRQSWPSLHLLADQIDRCRHLRGGEEVEHGGSSPGMWPVVERQRNARRTD